MPLVNLQTSSGFIFRISSCISYSIVLGSRSLPMRLYMCCTESRAVLESLSTQLGSASFLINFLRLLRVFTVRCSLRILWNLLSSLRSSANSFCADLDNKLAPLADPYYIMKITIFA